MTSNVFFSAQTLKKISNFCDTQLYGILPMVAPPQIIQEFRRKTPYFNRKKVANGLSGCTDNPHRLDPIKKGRPDNPFCTKFFQRTEVHTDKKLSGPIPRSK